MTPSIIAEIAKEHNGDLLKAQALLEDAARAGADAVKYQAYELSDLVPEHKNYKRYKECHLTNKKILDLQSHAINNGVEMYVSCFTIAQLPKLAKYFGKIKIPSTYLCYSDFVKLAIDNFQEIHISTGMHDFEVVIKMLDYYKKYAGNKILIPYHCVSMYPTPMNHLRLERVTVLRNRYGVVGYSDHSVGNKACLLAYHYGADFIEKHYAFNELHKPWCWTAESIAAFQTTLTQENILIADTQLTEQEKMNFAFYKEEFQGIKKSHLRLLTS